MSTLAAGMVSRPPFGIASRALTARLMMICSIWPGSALTTPRSGARNVVSRTSSPIRRLSSFSVPATVVFRSRALGWSTCWRLNASSWRVRAAAHGHDAGGPVLPLQGVAGERHHPLAYCPLLGVDQRIAHHLVGQVGTALPGDQADLGLSQAHAAVWPVDMGVHPGDRV